MGRIVAGAVAAPVLATILSGLATTIETSFWVAAVLQLGAFLLTSAIISRFVRRSSALSVGVGLGLTVGIISAYTLWVAMREGSSVRAPIVVLVYVVAATLFAAWMDRRHGAKVADLETDR